jgi:hypothetical protein
LKGVVASCPASLCPRTAIRVTGGAHRASTCTARRRSLPGRRPCQIYGGGSRVGHPVEADWMQVAHELRRSPRGALPGGRSRVNEAFGEARRLAVNRPRPSRALMREAQDQRAERREHVGSLDTGRCSDMFNRPEKAENTRVFCPSARRWMRPRRCLTGMQRTHSTDPDAVWTASDQLPSRPLPLRSKLHCYRDRVAARTSGGAAARWNRAVSRASGPIDRPNRDRFERAPLHRLSLIEAQSGDGMGLADRITQLVPRFGVEPQNAEGARR